LKKKMGWLVYSFPMEAANQLPKKGVVRRTLGDLLLSQKEQGIRLISNLHGLNPTSGTMVVRALALRDLLLDRQKLSVLLGQLPKDVREVFNLAFDSLELPESSRRFVCAFEDDPRGIMAARAAGLFVCAIGTRYTPEYMMSLEVPPHVAFSTFDEFAVWFNLNKER
jgi:hypothetical protein